MNIIFMSIIYSVVFLQHSQSEKINFRNDVRSIKFIFHHGPNYRDSQRYDLNETDKILNHPKFDKSRKTTIYVHGYTEGAEVQSVHVTIEAYLQRGDHNILLLEWSELASGNYFIDAVPNADIIGSLAAERLLDMFKKGLDVGTVHIIGHSVGGQIVGKIGREVIAKSKGRTKLRRITSLDPAFPKYYTHQQHYVPINRKDAEFVDIIHTDAWAYGGPSTGGTVDFWPNGGKSLQPGCPRRNYKQLTINDLCSHRRSWLIWAESVINKVPEKFLAVKARSWEDFKLGRTEPLKSYAVMGYYCPMNLTGNYYFQTNEDAPYARGERGIKYSAVKPRPVNWY